MPTKKARAATVERRTTATKVVKAPRKKKSADELMLEVWRSIYAAAHPEETNR